MGTSRGKSPISATAAAILGQAVSKSRTVVAPKRIKAERQKYYARLLELRDQLLQHGRDFTEQIQAKQQEVAALLEQRFHELRKDKTDRAALASLFSEVALRLNNEFRIAGVGN